jgi:hypothetical protein
MYSSVNDMPEDGLEVSKHVRGASENNKHLWSHMKLFGFNTLYFKKHNFQIFSHQKLLKR